MPVSQQKVDVLIIGAGLTGLSAAYHLSRPSTVVEAQSHTGGTAESISIKGFLLDNGVHILYFRDPWTRKWIVDELGVDLQTQERQSAVWIHQREVEFPIQFNLADLPPIPRLRYTISAIHASITTKPIADQQMTMETWARKNYGEPLTRDFFRPYNEKLWGVSLETLLTSWMGGYVQPPSVSGLLRGALFSQTRRIGANSKFYYPAKGGMNILSEAIERQIAPIQKNKRLVSLDLQQKTATFSTGESIVYNQMISTIPLPELIRLIHNSPASLIELGEKLKVTTTSLAHLLIPEKGIGKKYHWLYFPEIEIPFYRITFPHNIGPGCCPEGWSAMTLEYGCSVNDREAVGRESIKQLRRIGLLPPEVKDPEIFWQELPYGYVTYDSKWAETRNAIQSYFRKHGVLCLGRYGRWEYSNMESALLQGRSAAHRLEMLEKIELSTESSCTQPASDSTSDDTSNSAAVDLSTTKPLQKALPQCEGQMLLVVGEMAKYMPNILINTPMVLRIEDVSSSQINRLREQLLHKADWLEISSTSNEKDNRQYDIVIAQGKDRDPKSWISQTKELLKRCHQCLLIDYPEKPASIVPSVLKTAQELFAAQGAHLEWIPLKNSWLVKIVMETRS